jgi:hypothetical protein
MDARRGRATSCAGRLENGQSFDRAEIKTYRAGHNQATGHLEQTTTGRARAEGEGKVTLHERVNAMRRRRRRLPLRDRLRSRRRLVELGLKAKK